MEQFSVITEKKTVQNLLLKRIAAEAGCEVAVDTDENAVTVTGEDEDSRQRIIDAISKTIVEAYESKLILKLINQNYFYFNLPDRKSIFQKAVEYSESVGDSNSLVHGSVKKYLETTDKLMLDGFVNFRLKDYQSELGEVIDKAVEDFMIEKECKEFVKLLKYFVEVQKPKYDLVSIVPRGGTYLIFDDKGEDISKQCAREFIKDGGGISSDDLLISTLISIAPRRLCIHQAAKITNTELLRTIEQVFEKKITHCNGCDLCE